ncbi:transporter substrate-binding domain-containing protein [Halobacteriovorax sp. GB3]|uniref:substrate-binding periplasmic protein n=1 Tax=Halobacteriovorax sp. GB3 TaxID=2719615 RepID=UPI00235E434B|nr:transporter substrate-binding domain-containing protein [Halobacteriovorax sp. GB3]MDD0851526.1 transporter substrate-binding domain-containing protein [Halobacteriovorax sp. GB3]
MKSLITIVFILFKINFALAQDQGERILIGLSAASPPYIMKDRRSGYEIEIIREIFERHKYKVDFFFAPNKRIIEKFAQKNLDAIVNIDNDFIRKATPTKVYPSETLVTFKNIVITMKGKKLKDLNSLLGKRVLGFQNARVLLGKDFKKLSSQLKYYNETTNQETQVMMLLRGRIDVAISDQGIFNYFAKLHLKDKKVSDHFDFHPFFGQSPRSIIFHSKKLQEIFNSELQKLKNEGIIRDLNEKYSIH